MPDILVVISDFRGNFYQFSTANIQFQSWVKTRNEND